MKSALSSPGFTMIELLVALSITVITVSSVASLIGSALQQLTMTDQLQRAHYRASSHMAALESRPMKAGRQQGVYSVESDLHNQRVQPMKWTLALTPIEISDLSPQVRALTIRVQAMRAELQVEVPDSSRQLHFSSILFAVPSDDLSARSLDANETPVLR